MHILKKIFIFLMLCLFFINFFYFYNIFYCYGIFLFFYLLVEYINLKKTKPHYNQLSNYSLSPSIWIHDIINIFYYAHLNNKRIIFTLGYDQFGIEENNYELQFYLQAIASYDFFKFFIDHPGNNFIFFINRRGIIEKIALNTECKINYIDKKQFIIKTENSLQNKFTIITNNNIYREINNISLYRYIEKYLKQNQLEKKVN